MDVIEEKLFTAEKPVAILAKRAASLFVLPILGSICYAAPYVTGLVYRQTYFQKFNVPETMFKSDVNDYFIYAYMAVLETLKNWTTFISSPLLWLSMVGFILALTLEILFLGKLPNTPVAKTIAKTLNRNKYVAVSTGLVSLAAAITAVILLVPLIAFPLILLPAVVGSYGANQALERDLAIYDKGCSHPVALKDQCHVIMDGTRVVAAGFLIAASDTRAVIYEANKARIIPVKDFSIETLLPKDYEGLIATRKIPGIAVSDGAQP